MDPTRGDSRYNLNYSMGGIGLGLTDPADLYGSPGLSTVTGRPPSGGLIQTMGRSQPGLMGSAGNPTGQCQTLGGGQQARGVKRTSSDCYEDHHRASAGSGGGGGMQQSQQSLQGLESCASSVGGGGQGQQQPGPGSGGVPDGVDDGYTNLPNKKSPPANGKKTKGRVKIKMEYIDNKLRRYTTFSKRKTGIMKKAYELSTLTGTQVMLLVASETGHVYTFATRKLQPMITSEAGKQLIQTCLNSPDPPSTGGGDQRMSATGFEETELSYNIADEDSKDGRSPMSSGDSDDSSDGDEPGPANLSKDHILMNSENPAKHSRNASNSSFTNPGIPQISQEFLLNLVQSGHLQLHADEDGRQIATMQMVPATGNSSTSSIVTVGSNSTIVGSNSGASSSSRGPGGGGGGGGGGNNQGRNRNNRTNKAKDLSSKAIRTLTMNGRNMSPMSNEITIKEEIFDDF